MTEAGTRFFDRGRHKNVIEVWAPRAKKVCAQIDGRELGMALDEFGWWRLEVSDKPHDLDYAFVLDGSTALPDPRSPSQPYGVHGKSRFVDHNRFNWNDAGWNAPPLGSGIIYE